MVNTQTKAQKPGGTLTYMFVRKKRSRHLPSGYLLLEVTLALAISTLVLATVFKITDWNLSVSNDAMESSNTHMKESAFFSFMERAFLELPGDSLLELTTIETATHNLSEMIIQNAGEVFSWPNQPFTASAIKIITQPNSNRTIDILLEYYEHPLLENPQNNSEVAINENQKPLQTLILLDDIWRFEWRAWNASEVDQNNNPIWNTEWVDTSSTPRYIELNAVFDPRDKPLIHNFWNPRKINPEAHFQENITQSNNSTEATDDNPAINTEQ